MSSEDKQRYESLTQKSKEPNLSDDERHKINQEISELGSKYIE
jgi:hypothetical protein